MRHPVQKPTRMRFATWEARFRPVQNHITPGSPCEGRLFETYGDDVAHVMAQPPEKVWTIVECDRGKLVLTNGRLFANRFAYFVTEVPWAKGDLIEVRYA